MIDDAKKSAFIRVIRNVKGEEPCEAYYEYEGTEEEINVLLNTVITITGLHDIDLKTMKFNHKSEFSVAFTGMGRDSDKFAAGFRQSARIIIGSIRARRSREG